MNPLERGFTMVEVLVVFALTAIMMGIAVSNLKELNSSSRDAASEIVAFLKEIRAKAISTTRAYTVSASGNDTLVARYASVCSDASPTLDSSARLELPAGTHLTNTAWTICFTSRGLADDAITIPVEDAQSRAETVEIVLGGAARIQ